MAQIKTALSKYLKPEILEAFKSEWDLPKNYPISVLYDSENGDTQIRVGCSTGLGDEEAENQAEGDGEERFTLTFWLNRHPNCCGISILHSFYTYRADREVTDDRRKALYELLNNIIDVVQNYKMDARYNYLWSNSLPRDRRVELVAVRNDRRAGGRDNRESTLEPELEDASKFYQSLFVGWLFSHKVTSADVFLNKNSNNFCQRMTVLF